MVDSDQHLLFSLFFLVIISALTGYYALQKGRNFYVWFAIGLLISFFAPLVLFFLPSLKKGEDLPGDRISGSTSISPEPAPLELPPKAFQNLPSSEKLWYYLDENHKQYGPVSIIALKNLFDTAKLGLHSYVWSEGMERWERVDDLQELKEALHRPGPLL